MIRPVPGVTAGYSDAELEAMMAGGESDLVERNASLDGDAGQSVREAVCAFANDLPDHRRSGVVLIGATDDGRPSGLAITDRLLLQLADIRSDGDIVPPPSLTVGKRLLFGEAVAVVTVQPSDAPPVRYRGRTWVRAGPRRAVATVQDERALNDQRRHRNPHFDARPVQGATLSDLKLGVFQDDYLPAALAREALAANDRTLEERLIAAKMVLSVEEPVPTVAGILMLGKRPEHHLPGAYVQFLRIAGVELGDEVTDEARCTGPVVELIRRLEDKLTAHNRTSVDFTSGPAEIRRSTYPIEALHQLVRNAVMHRTYEATNAPVQVYWFDDRIEINNPGGPYGSVTADNFGEPGALDYRNPIVAEAMRVLGLVQRFGFGIPAARRALKENGQRGPEFRVEPHWVRCTVRMGDGR